LASPDLGDSCISKKFAACYSVAQAESLCDKRELSPCLKACLPVIHLTAEELHREPQYDAIQWKLFVIHCVSLVMIVMAGCEHCTLLWKRVQ